MSSTDGKPLLIARGQQEEHVDYVDERLERLSDYFVNKPKDAERSETTDGKDEHWKVEWLSEEGLRRYRRIRAYYTKYILLPICIYGSIRTIRPHSAYVVSYLEQEGGYTKMEVENWGIFTQYAVYIAGIYLLGYIGVDGPGGMRPLILVETVLLVFSRLCFVFVKAPQCVWMISAFVATGFSYATESMIFIYRTHIIDHHFNQQMVSWTSASFYFAAFLSGVISRLILAYYDMTMLFYTSVATILIAAIVAYFTFPSCDRQLQNCFDDLVATEHQISTAEGVPLGDHVGPQRKSGFLSTHTDSEIQVRKDTIMKRKQIERKSASEWPSSLHEKISKTWIYLYSKDGGLFWACAWVIVTVSELLIHAEIPMRWLDISPEATQNGLMEGLSNIGALMGSLLPWILENSWPSRHAKTFCMMGLSIIVAFILLLGFVENLYYSYVLFIAYKCIVVWMLSFNASKLIRTINSADPEGKIVLFFCIFMITIVVIGLQFPVRVIWHVIESRKRFLYYGAVTGCLSILCLCLANARLDESKQDNATGVESKSHAGESRSPFILAGDKAK